MTHYEAIQSRYAHFSGVFSYNSLGRIIGVNRDFRYNGTYNHIEILQYLLTMFDLEYHHLIKITDVDDLITTVHTFFMNDPVMRVL